MHGDEQVAGQTTALPRCTLAVEPDALAVLDTRGDAHVDRVAAHRAATAVAVGARIVDEHAAPAAPAARLGKGEAALVAGGLAGAEADRALVRERSTFPAGAVAGRACLLAGHP